MRRCDLKRFRQATDGPDHLEARVRHDLFDQERDHRLILDHEDPWQALGSFRLLGICPCVGQDYALGIVNEAVRTQFDVAFDAVRQISQRALPAALKRNDAVERERTEPFARRLCYGGAAAFDPTDLQAAIAVVARNGPGDLDLSAPAQCPVFGGIGCQFVQHHAQRCRGPHQNGDIRTVEYDIGILAIRRKLSRDQRSQVGLFP